ncbi:MAG: hypothetical protein ACR5K5_01675 [Wolbachia sp.]
MNITYKKNVFSKEEKRAARLPPQKKVEHGILLRAELLCNKGKKQKERLHSTFNVLNDY